MDDEKRLNTIFDFAKDRLGLRKTRILAQVEHNLQLDVQSQQRLDGAIASAAQMDSGIARRDVLVSLLAIGGLSAGALSYQSSHNLFVSRAIVEKIPQETASQLAQLFKKSLNDIAELTRHAELYKAQGSLSAFEVIDRLLDYRKGRVFIGPGVADTESFWDSRILDNDAQLSAFKGLFKSREFLRNDNPQKSREVLNAIKIHNANSLPQKLNIEIMAAESLGYLKSDPMVGHLLDEVSQTFGKIWSFTPREILDAIDIFGPVAIIVYYHSHFLFHLRNGGEVVGPADTVMASLREIACTANVDVSKECWNGCLFSSFFINRAGSLRQGRAASEIILGETSFFKSSPNIQAEIQRARAAHDNQMMYALFQSMENEYQAKKYIAGDRLHDELSANYQVPIKANSMYYRRFGDIGHLRDGRKPIASELLPINSHYLYLTPRKVAWHA